MAKVFEIFGLILNVRQIVGTSIFKKFTLGKDKKQSAIFKRYISLVETKFL